MTNFQETTNRTYKARLFAMIYSQKKELLELYNAINGTNYDDPEKLEINTLGNAIYMSMANDISFIIDSQLMLYEHQSTYSPNLPIRYLMYVADLYSKITKDANLYGSRQVQIPTPRFLIFYNGIEEQPDEKELWLSESFIVKERNPSLELKATMLNVNRGRNRKLMDSCKTLRDYAEYTARVREYAERMPVGEAVEQAITECIREGVLSEFLSTYRAEARKVSIYEYDEEKHMRQEREQNWEDGHAAGVAEGRAETIAEAFKVLIETLQDLGLSREETAERVSQKFSTSQEEAEKNLEKYWK